MTDPLAPPADRELLDEFCRFFRVALADDRRERLTQIAAAFAGIPYENLSKIVKHAAEATPTRARRGPAEVLRDHYRLGSGGTCFSLTAALLYLVRSLGLAAAPILADRRYGPDTHCALVAWLDGLPHLIDPGFLITQPIPLAPLVERRLATRFNQLLLRPSGGDRLDLFTCEGGGERFRLTFKTSPVDNAQFLRAWDASFDWDMMRYPVATRVVGGEQRYWRRHHFQTRTPGGVTRVAIDPDVLLDRIAREFGISRELISQALAARGK